MQGKKAQRHEGTKAGQRQISAFPSCLRAFVPLCLLLSSCTYESSTQGPETQTLEQRQDAAIRDPIKNNYEDNVRPYDISGGGINNLDKNALDRDLKHVFGP
jgi:hypothetical protein